MNPRFARIRSSALTVAFIALAFPACQSFNANSVQQARPYVQPAATLAATGALLAARPEYRVVTAKYMYSVALGIRSLTGETIPTVSDVQKMLTQFTPNGAQYDTLTVSLLAIYQGVYPQIRGDNKLAFEVLEDIAHGCELAAQPYIPFNK